VVARGYHDDLVAVDVHASNRAKGGEAGTENQERFAFVRRHDILN
jgi:hypothetical protein